MLSHQIFGLYTFHLSDWIVLDPGVEHTKVFFYALIIESKNEPAIGLVSRHWTPNKAAGTRDQIELRVLDCSRS